MVPGVVTAPQPLLLTTEALAHLLEANQARLLRTIAVRLNPSLGRRVAPEDVLQDAYVAAAARLHHRVGSPYSSDFLWLRAIVLQTITDCHRSHLGAGMRDAMREAAPAMPAPASAPTMAQLFAASATSPSGVAMKRETSQSIAQALELLSEADREVVALRHFEDLGNNEIAEVLGIQVKAASIRYIRAVMRLKELLAERGVTLGDLRGR